MMEFRSRHIFKNDKNMARFELGTAIRFQDARWSNFSVVEFAVPLESWILCVKSGDSIAHSLLIGVSDIVPTGHEASDQSTR